MSTAFGCNCAERKKPVKERRWVVTKYMCNYSAFNGYRCTHSEYSTVLCEVCGSVGRTKAAYVDQLVTHGKESR